MSKIITTLTITMAPTQDTGAGAWPNLKRISLIVHLLLLASTELIAETVPVAIGIPAAQRNEGRVVLEYVKNEETIKYQLAFSEVVDRETSRSKVSIGYMSYEPTVYYSRDGDMLTVDKKTGQCVSLKSKGYKLVPELDWFVKLSYTDEELERALPADKSHHLIGASGIVLMLTKTQTTFSHQERHRNIDCHVATARYGRTKAKDILYELFVPDLKMFETNKMTFFSVRETVKSAKLEDGTEFSATLTIDYFYTEEINKDNLHQVDRLEVDLNLPLGVGCSELLSTATRPESRGSQSFLMTYNQNSAQSVLELAYDHGANLLRKEVLGKSAAVWDLSEDLVYHVDKTVNGKLFNEAETEVPYEVCSVLSVESSSGKSSNNSANQATTTTPKSVMMKPYKQSASSLDVLEFLGAQEIYYMGQASVRDLPCWIFEITLREPPRIFEIDLRVQRVDESPPEQATDYIVQFYIFKTSGSTTTTSILSPSAAPDFVGNKFWPARINLIQRHKASGRLMLYDILEVGDFHWGLYGWTKKPSELFMMPECFNREDEQLRISLALEFDRLLLSADNQRLLRHNKYKLERDLIAAMFGPTGKSLLQVSQLHLTEFELTLKAHNVLAQLVLSDRLEDKRLSYFGEGDLPNASSYQNQRISLTNLDSSSGNSESACIMSASHIAQISMVIYCPSRDWVASSTCTAIFDEPQPVIKKTAPMNSSSGERFGGPTPVACQVYRFESRDPPRAATHEVDKIKKQLLDYRFVFTAQQPAASVDQDDDKAGIVFNGVVRDFDVSRELELITVSNYKYVVEEAEEEETKKITRSFETIKYNNLGDCAKMCDLDTSCKSYSYCNGGDSGKCILASLDLRQNGVEHQLVNSKFADDNRVIVRDLSSTGDDEDTNNTNGLEYKLDLKSGCNIYERNFLNMFTRTDELIRMRANVAAHFHTAPSASECARWINVLEDQMDSVHTSMFAYCSNSNTCLIDENFFVSLAGDGDNKTDDPDTTAADLETDSRELTCQVFRRRYQNYFHISPRVVKRKPQEEEIAQLVQQTEFQFNSVEQCARACWQSYGHSCLSFDFCSPSNCLLNLIGESNNDHQVTREQLTQSMEWEVRTGCLHYERDLQWDKLRRDHSIGHYKPLVMPNDSPKQSSNGLVANFGILVISSILFILGLAVGHRVNRSLAHVTPALRRAPKDTRPQERTAFGVSSASASLSSSSSPYERMSSSSTNFAASNSSKFTIENEIYEDPDAIRLEEMGANKREQVDESEAEAEQQQSADLTTIQVPDLMKI